jgi:hypothetical protein
MTHASRHAHTHSCCLILPPVADATNHSKLHMILEQGHRLIVPWKICTAAHDGRPALVRATARGGSSSGALWRSTSTGGSSGSRGAVRMASSGVLSQVDIAPYLAFLKEKVSFILMPSMQNAAGVYSSVSICSPKCVRAEACMAYM